MPAEHYEVVFSGSVAVTPEYEELLLHEIGHAFYYLVPGWWDEEAWSRAAELDSFHMGTWGLNNVGEDYAESFVAWAILRGYGANLSAPSSTAYQPDQ